ncbi:MAG: RNA recognition motif domain-containing protein [Fibrobacterota bacterium]
MNIYVGNISWGVNDDELRESFEAHGEVESARIIKDRESGRSKGFGFVEMPDEDSAEAAIEAMNDAELDGRPLKVNKARPRKPRTDRF